MTYANGRAPESALVVVDGVHVVPSIAPRVAAFLAYSAVQGQPQHIVALGGYCTLAEQRARQHTGSVGSSIQVADVGHSTHGDYAVGRVDLVGANKRNYTAADLAFQIAHCPSFGLEREFGDRDPNHWREVGAWNPTTTPQMEDEMKPLLIGIENKNGTKQWALVSPDLARFVPIWVAATANDLSKMFGTLVYVVKDEWNGFRAAAGLAPDNTVGK